MSTQTTLSAIKFIKQSIDERMKEFYSCCHRKGLITSLITLSCQLTDTVYTLKNDRIKVWYWSFQEISASTLYNSLTSCTLTPLTVQCFCIAHSSHQAHNLNTYEPIDDDVSHSFYYFSINLGFICTKAIFNNDILDLMMYLRNYVFASGWRSSLVLNLDNSLIIITCVNWVIGFRFVSCRSFHTIVYCISVRGWDNVHHRGRVVVLSLSSIITKLLSVRYSQSLNYHIVLMGPHYRI